MVKCQLFCVAFSIWSLPWLSLQSSVWHRDEQFLSSLLYPHQEIIRPVGSLKIILNDKRKWKIVTQYDKGQNHSCDSKGLMTQSCPPPQSYLKEFSLFSIARYYWPSRGTSHMPFYVLLPLSESFLLASDLLGPSNLPSISLLGGPESDSLTRSGAPRMFFLEP